MTRSALSCATSEAGIDAVLGANPEPVAGSGCRLSPPTACADRGRSSPHSRLHPPRHSRYATSPNACTTARIVRRARHQRGVQAGWARASHPLAATCLRPLARSPACILDELPAARRRQRRGMRWSAPAAPAPAASAPPSAKDLVQLAEQCTERRAIAMYASIVERNPTSRGCAPAPHL